MGRGVSWRSTSGRPTRRRTSWPGSGARTATALAVRVPPSGATIRRVVKDTCPGGLADLLGHDPAGTDTLALDGKNARGSRLGATPAAHPPAAMTGTGMTVTQPRVPEKTNEITCFTALLDPYDPQGVTAPPATPTSPPDSARQPSAPTNAPWASSASTDLQRRTIKGLRNRPGSRGRAPARLLICPEYRL